MGRGLKIKLLSFIFFITVTTLQLYTAHGMVIIDTRKNDQDMIIFGAKDLDGLGYPIFAEDINGDGVKDFIVSSTASDGLDESEVNRGAVYVVFGRSSMPVSADISSLADVSIYGVEHGINGVEGDEAGYALAATDLNNDGIKDLIIAGIYADGPDNSRPDAGEVYVIYGRNQFPSVMDLSVDADIIIYGADGGDCSQQICDPEDPDKGDMAGYALATGDFNNDGLNDLVISAVLGDGPQNQRAHSGETYVIWGSQQPPAIIDLANASNVTTIWGADGGDYSGFALFAKDLNGDNVDDLMIGALMADGVGNARDNSGETYILYGRDSFPSTIDLANGADVTIYGAEAGDQNFNPVNYISSADVNDDGLPDLIIGTPFADGEMNDRIDSGEVYIVLGKTTLPSSIDLSTDADTVIYGITEYDNFGFSIAVGDVNGDNISDILVSAVSADGVYDVWPSAGEAYLIYGRQNFPPVMDASDADVRIYGGGLFDILGVSMYIADINGDSVDDILVGTVFGDGIDDTAWDRGEAIIIFGVDGGIGLEALAPKDGESIACQTVFEWTPGRSGNFIWAFQLFESPDLSRLLHTSPYLNYPKYELPDNFLEDFADIPLYWKVYGVNFNESPPRAQESQLFSFTREGIHLMSPADSDIISSPPTMEWTPGCPENSYLMGISEDPSFNSFVYISPTLDNTSWTIPDTIWETLSVETPLYWLVLGVYQPVPWRAHIEYSKEGWSFIKNE